MTNSGPNSCSSISLPRTRTSPRRTCKRKGGGHASVAWSDGTGARDVMNQYYDVAASPDLFKSGFMGLTGGSTWAWRGNTPRCIPYDFRLKTTYGGADDWPRDDTQYESAYVEADEPAAVSGTTKH